MNKKIVTALGLCLIPVGAILLTACGPEESMLNQQDELALDTASDNWRMINNKYSEYGKCLDRWDNDGDGRVDEHDPDCHTIGPLRDLSLYNYPVGHNFNPDVSKIPANSPGYPGGFRDRAQMVKWFRFLTEPDGYTAGMYLFGPGVNPELVPIPAPLAKKINQGTYHFGNNNNVSVRGLSGYFPGDVVVPAAAAADAPAAAAAAAQEFKVPAQYGKTSNFGLKQGLQYKGGSQTGKPPWSTGNPDDSRNNSAY